MKGPIRLNGGSVMIMVLFITVYMILLASLSLVTADSQLALAKRTAEQTSEYYAADTRAVEIFEEIKNGDYNNVNVSPAKDGPTVYEYMVEIDDVKSIAVRVIETSGTFAIDKWLLVSTREWEPDGGLLLWSEDEVFIMD